MAFEPISVLFRVPPKCSTPRPALFLDRDGVINRRIAGGYVKNREDFHLIPEAINAIAAVCKPDIPVIVVSNQAGVGKGCIDAAELVNMTCDFVAELHRRSVIVHAVYYCPHTTEQDCDCRKPKAGLIRRAAKDWNIDVAASVMIGDSMTDVEAAWVVGCSAVLFDPQGSYSSAPGVVVARTMADLTRQARALLRSDFSG